MDTKRTSVFENGLVWFGAAVSLAEILTGTYFAPLGFTKGILAVIIGHILGFIIGSTLPDVIITLLMCIAVNKIKGIFKNEQMCNYWRR